MALKTKFESHFNYGDKVAADGGDVMMTVVAFNFTPMGCQVQCAWFASGSHHDNWFYEWRLGPCQKS